MVIRNARWRASLDKAFETFALQLVAQQLEAIVESTVQQAADARWWTCTNKEMSVPVLWQAKTQLSVMSML